MMDLEHHYWQQYNQLIDLEQILLVTVNSLTGGSAGYGH